MFWTSSSRNTDNKPPEFLADCSNKSPFLKSQDAKRGEKPQTLHRAVSQPCTIVRLSCSPLQALQQLKSEGWSLDKDARGQNTHTHNQPTLLLNALKRLNVWAHVDGFLFFSGSLSVWRPPSQVWASGFSLLRCERHQPCFSQTTANLTARTGDAHCVLEMCHSVRVHGGGLHGVCFTLDGEGGEEDSCAIRKQ